MSALLGIREDLSKDGEARKADSARALLPESSREIVSNAPATTFSFTSERSSIGSSTWDGDVTVLDDSSFSGDSASSSSMILV